MNGKGHLDGACVGAGVGVEVGIADSGMIHPQMHGTWTPSRKQGHDNVPPISSHVDAGDWVGLKVGMDCPL
jgi:hypothetical protein